MTGGLEIVVTIAGIAIVGLLLAVGWMLIQRKLGVPDVPRPQEDPEVQMHQAQRNAGAGFGP